MSKLTHISEEVRQEFLAFAQNNPEIISTHHAIQKLVIFDFVAPYVEKHPHGTILEIGAGLGFHSALLSHFGKVSATDLAMPGSFVGCDGDVDDKRRSVLCELAKSNVTSSSNDGRRLPYEDGSFDLVFHNSVIEHVPNVLLFNREIGRVLRPGGICICVTGTPALCRFRIVKDFILKLPINILIAIIREAPPLRGLVVNLLKMLGKSDEKCKRIVSRLQRVDERIRSLINNESSFVPECMCRNKGLRKYYSQLFHYIYSPDYNLLVADEIANELGLSVDDMLVCLEDHFDSMVNRILFYLTPHTHGQHYRNVWHEMKEWRIERWQEQFKQSGFNIEDIIGYRYHHLLEFTPSFALDTALYSRAAHWIHLAIKRRMFNPATASEIIIVARKDA